jgi:hypothetical protein
MACQLMVDRKVLTSFGVEKSAAKRHILEPLRYGLREDLPHEEKLRGENNKGAVSGVTSKLSVSLLLLSVVVIFSKECRTK